jgi:uncharacterized protein YcfL
MKRLWILMLLSLFLVGCGANGSTTATTSMSSTTSGTVSSSATSSTVTTTSSTGTTPAVVLATPEIFWSDANTLQWEPIEGAEEYHVLVGDTVYPTTNAWIGLGDLPDNAFYEVSVQAVADGKISLWSATEEYAKFVPWGNGFSVVYSVLNPQDFSFVLGADLTVLDIRYAEEEPSSGKTNESIVKSMEGNGFSLGKAYVTEAADGVLEYIVYTTLGSFPLSLSRTQQEGPYVANPSTFSLFGDVPAFFRLELDGCEWDSLSGNNITPSDYSFADGTLTISRSFLDPLFDENPTRNVVLGFLLNDGDDSIVGILVINRP